MPTSAAKRERQRSAWRQPRRVQRLTTGGSAQEHETQPSPNADRHRRQLESVRAEALGWKSSVDSAPRTSTSWRAFRSRLQKIEVDLVEATVRRESVIESCTGVGQWAR